MAYGNGELTPDKDALFAAEANKELAQGGALFGFSEGLRQTAINNVKSGRFALPDPKGTTLLDEEDDTDKLAEEKAKKDAELAAANDDEEEDNLSREQELARRADRRNILYSEVAAMYPRVMNPHQAAHNDEKLLGDSLLTSTNRKTLKEAREHEKKNSKSKEPIYPNATSHVEAELARNEQRKAAKAAPAAEHHCAV